MHVWFVGLRGHYGENAGKYMVRPLFLLLEFFCLGRNSRETFCGLEFWHLWIGRARHPGPSFTSLHLGIEVLNVGGWLTHGDLALDTGVDFLAVVEHRLIPARVRSEWSRLRKKDLASIWSPASQASSHVGSAGVGVVSLRGGSPFSSHLCYWLSLRGSLTVVGVDLEAAWALAAGIRPAVTCKKNWESAGAHRRDVMVGCPLTVAAVSYCKVLDDRWIAPHLAVRTLFDCCRWTCSVTLVVQRTTFGLLLGYLLLIKVGVPGLLRFKGFGRFMMSVFQFMSRRDALLLDASLAAGDVSSQAWAVWSGAVESALVDAYQFSGGPLPSRGLVWGRGRASFRVVELGGHKVRKARGYAADAHDAADVFLYRDSSIAPLLDLRRRLKAVMELVDADDSLWCLSFSVY